MQPFSIGTLCAVVAAFFWGTLAVFTKQLKLEGFTASDLSQLRVFGLGIVLLIFALTNLKNIVTVSRKDLFLIFCAGIFGQALNMYFYFLSVQMIPAGIAVLLEYLAPVFIGIVAIFLGWEKLTKNMIISLSLIMIGLFISIGYNLDLDIIPFNGMIFGILAGISLAGFALISKPLLKKHSPLKILSYGIWSASIFWICLKNPTEIFSKLALTNNNQVFYSIIFIIFLCTLLPFLLYLLSIKLIGPTKATMISCLEPFFSAVMCAIICKEILTTQQCIGGIVVLCGIILLESRNLTRIKQGTNKFIKKEHTV